MGAELMVDQGPFEWAEEHHEIRSMLRARFDDADAVDLARRALEDQDETRAEQLELWRSLCQEIGLAGLTIPETFGGMGCGRIELAVVAEEMGRVVLGGPYLSTVVLAAETIMASEDDDVAGRLLPKLIDGTQTAALAVAERSMAWADAAVVVEDGRLHGTKHGVLGALDADHLIVSARDGDDHSLFLVDVVDAGDGVRIDSTPGIDGTRTVSSVQFDGAACGRLGEAGAADAVLRSVRQTAAVFLASELTGVSRRCVEMTAEYARDRIQFGQPIGGFQAVKHRLADMEVRTHQSESAAAWAAWQVPNSDQAELGAAVARIWCSDAAVQNAFDTIQLHGGIGITWEHEAHLLLRRAQADSMMLGPLSVDRSWLAERLEGQEIR